MTSIHIVLGVLNILVVLIIIYKLSKRTSDIECFATEKSCNANTGVCYIKTIIDNDKTDGDKIMAELNMFGEQLIKVLVHNDKDYPPTENADRVQLLRKRYSFGKTTKLEEVVPGNSQGYTSYTENKGSKMGICFRQSDMTPVKMNDLKFVFAHELAHIATLEHGHTDKFWKNFKWILKYAYENKLIDYVDYSRNHATYCGITITSNPYKM